MNKVKLYFYFPRKGVKINNEGAGRICRGGNSYKAVKCFYTSISFEFLLSLRPINLFFPVAYGEVSNMALCFTLREGEEVLVDEAK